MNLLAVQRQCFVVVEETSVEPRHCLESDPPPARHCTEEVARQFGEFVGPFARVLKHPGEHVVREQPDVFGEHAEHEPVDEVRHALRLVAPLAKRLRELREGRCRALRQRLSALTRPEPLRVGHRPLQLVAHARVGKVLQRELVGQADAVGPVGADSEPRHVRDDEQRRVLECQRVLPQLIECGVKVRPAPLVLPREAVALPHVGPAVAAGVLACPALEAVVLAGRVDLGRCRLSKQPAQIDEVFLRRRALLQLRCSPLGDELTWCHGSNNDDFPPPAR